MCLVPGLPYKWFISTARSLNSTCIFWTKYTLLEVVWNGSTLNDVMSIMHLFYYCNHLGIADIVRGGNL